MDDSITEQDRFWGQTYHTTSVTIAAPFDSITVEIQFEEGKPVNATMLSSEPDDTVEVPSDSGEGSARLLRTLLRYVHLRAPSLTHVEFEDHSIVYPDDPLPLRYFWMAFGGKGETWFETHFRAIYQSDEAHAAYKKAIHTFFCAPLPPFHDFLRTLPRSDLLVENQPLFQEVEQWYTTATTYKGLLDSIPRDRRQEHARTWVIYWIEDHLKYVLERKMWYIPLPLASSDPLDPLDSSDPLAIQRDGGWDTWREQKIMYAWDLEDE